MNRVPAGSVVQAFVVPVLADGGIDATHVDRAGIENEADRRGSPWAGRDRLPARSGVRRLPNRSIHRAGVETRVPGVDAGRDDGRKAGNRAPGRPPVPRDAEILGLRFAEGTGQGEGGAGERENLLGRLARQAGLLPRRAAVAGEENTVLGGRVGDSTGDGEAGDISGPCGSVRRPEVLLSRRSGREGGQEEGRDHRGASSGFHDVLRLVIRVTARHRTGVRAHSSQLPTAGPRCPEPLHACSENRSLWPRSARPENPRESR